MQNLLTEFEENDIVFEDNIFHSKFIMRKYDEVQKIKDHPYFLENGFFWVSDANLSERDGCPWFSIENIEGESDLVHYRNMINLLKEDEKNGTFLANDFYKNLRKK